MRGPRVSVVLTCYNAAWCVERALDSVLAQTRPPDEIVVGDDGSTDDTVARIERRCGERAQVLRLPHRGVGPARRASFAAATGEWLAWLDADDLWKPERLERQLRFLEAHPQARWLSSDGDYVSAYGVLRDSWLSDYFEKVNDLVGDLFPYLVERCFPLASSSLIHADAYRAVGGIDPGLSCSEDYDLWLRLAARFPGAVMADRLVAYVASPHQLSRRVEERNRADLRLMQRVARGELRRDAALQRRAAARASALEFEIGVKCLRSGRRLEAQGHLLRAIAAGPWRRRVVALVGALAPRWSLPRLMRSGRLKNVVQGARRRALRITAGTEVPR